MQVLPRALEAPLLLLFPSSMNLLDLNPTFTLAAVYAEVTNFNISCRILISQLIRFIV